MAILVSRAELMCDFGIGRYEENFSDMSRQVMAGGLRVKMIYSIHLDNLIM